MEWFHFDYLTYQTKKKKIYQLCLKPCCITSLFSHLSKQYLVFTTTRAVFERGKPHSMCAVTGRNIKHWSTNTKTWMINKIKSYFGRSDRKYYGPFKSIFFLFSNHYLSFLSPLYFPLAFSAHYCVTSQHWLRDVISFPEINITHEIKCVQNIQN